MMSCWFLVYNNVNQPEVYLYHLRLQPLSHPPHPTPTPQVITKHKAGLPVLCSSFSLPIYSTHGSVQMSMLFSQFVPMLPLMCSQVHSLHLHLCSYTSDRFIHINFSRFHIYALMCNICFSPSNLLHSV